MNRDRGKISFPAYSGLRCLMMPYIQGDLTSLPDEYIPYWKILADLTVEPGRIGYLTIDESPIVRGKPHRGARAKYGRALHTEAGKCPQDGTYCWGDGNTWGGSKQVLLDRDLRIIIASNLSDSCAVWPGEHPDTSLDGDIGYAANQYPYEDARFLKAGEVCEIGILTPHESVPLFCDGRRQFLRIVGSGVRGREEYFTVNPLLS